MPQVVARMGFCRAAARGRASGQANAHVWLRSCACGHVVLYNVARASAKRAANTQCVVARALHLWFSAIYS